MKLLLLEKKVGSNFSGIYRKFFDKISNRDERWSFLECLEGLELNDFWLGFNEWGLIKDLADRAVEPPDSFKRLISSEAYSKIWRSF